MTNSVLDLAFQVSRTTEENIDLIESVMKQTTLLAINARIEATRAGTAGGAFGVVARELSEVAEEICRISGTLRRSIRDNISKLEDVGAELNRNYRGTRYADLALNAIEIIDRNLYERSCDVRWWATDSAMVEVAENPTDDAINHACERLATILRSYTVYLDLWVADASGRVIAVGRRQKYPKALGADVKGVEWFGKAMQTRTGEDFVACNVTCSKLLDNAQVATYATAIRSGGRSTGKKIGALGIFFDWAPQAKAVVTGVGLAPEERQSTHVMIVDSSGQIIASSQPLQGGTAFRLQHNNNPRGYYVADDRLVAYALTPGYETYKGLGWYGVIDAPMTM
jgi:ribosomal protein S13